MTRLNIMVGMICVLSMMTAIYSVKSMLDERERFDVASTELKIMEKALLRKLVTCNQQSDEWAKLIQDFVKSHETCEAEIDFNHAIKSLDRAIQLQKKNKLLVNKVN